MSDALQRLAPPIPPQPPPAEAGGEFGWIALLLFLAVALLAPPLARAVRRVRQRRQLLRALAGLDREDPPHVTAQQLAGIVRRFALEAPATWWRDIDALRFSPPDPDAGTAVATLREAVARFRRSPR